MEEGQEKLYQMLQTEIGKNAAELKFQEQIDEIQTDDDLILGDPPLEFGFGSEVDGIDQDDVVLVAEPASDEEAWWCRHHHGESQCLDGLSHPFPTRRGSIYPEKEAIDSKWLSYDCSFLWVDALVPKHCLFSNPVGGYVEALVDLHFVGVDDLSIEIGWLDPWGV
ncbi:hypothetical protein C2S52_014596 [Perilla frutescens var. hirtella]|nr:hypothetical protein C2S52_014596 [Perilla frutescens var. hirtella]